ncbi:MAG TPA: hypothetical protein VFB22_09990 [Candidatus Baltobacteraceae bacterium]|nr:hypothetical protein [Candidatus Baltobacteraceae bacterium]
MSAEWVSATAAVATLLVVAASAFAALTQLRHMRGSNQITSMLELRETVESRQFAENYRVAIRFLTENYDDPELRRRILTAERLSAFPEFEAVFAVGGFFENCGCLVKYDFIDKEIFCDLLSAMCAGAWKAFAPLVAHRRLRDGNAVYDNFEYLAVLSEDWIARHPEGAYPPGVRRMLPPPLWPEAAELTHGPTARRGAQRVSS